MDQVHPIAEKKGIKECEDMLKAVDALVDQVKVALADGKVSTVEVLTMLVAMAGPVRDALDGVVGIGAELKDLDQDEVAKLSSQLFAIGAKIMGLKKS